ncbi:hypothetical protein OB905_12285 [Halobacteria archaeon AArc-dxtr1]|nr:hypothetical protein [Halobacteria archaeon AArc-dxtr1]
MIWQDIVFTLGGFTMALLLTPTIINPESTVPRSTSVPTGMILFIFSGTFASLGLYLSALAHVFSASMWTTIALLRHPRE